MNIYGSYIKCGEILKSPTINEEDQKFQFVLKCWQCCEDHFILLDSFILPPCTNKSKENLSIFGLNDQNENTSEDVDIKYEDIDIDADEVDPLNTNIIKNNTIDEGKNEIVKDAGALQETEDYSNCMYENAGDSLKEEQLSNYSDEAHSENSESDNESVQSEDSNSPLFVHNFIKSEKNVTCLIEAYKKQTQLWNQKCPQFRLKMQHDKYLEKIQEELKEKINLQMSNTQIASVITYLCRKYRQDLKKNKLTEIHGDANDEKSQPASWFFSQLEFLKKIMEKNLVTTLNKSSRKANLEPQQITQIVGIYERFPYLWNTDLIENVCKNKRLEALGEMQKIIETEMNLKLNEIALKSHIHFLHNHFSKIKRCIAIEGCTKNDKYYKNMQFLMEHVGPFKCPHAECGQVFKSPLTFKVHKSQHDGSTALRCSLCQKEYSNSGPYISHARRHMEDLSEECKECGKKFLVASDLKIHMRSHTGVQPYCCEVCGISFRHSTSLNVHRRRHEKQYLHKCPICAKGFYKKDRMNDHIRSHNNIRDFACKTCGKAFKTRKTLKQHEVTHEDVRRHACSLCGKAFKLKVGLLQHMRTHGGQI